MFAVVIQEALALTALFKKIRNDKSDYYCGTCGAQASARPTGRSLFLSAALLASKLPSEANASLARAKTSGRQQNVRDTCEVEQTLGRQRWPHRPLAAEKATKELPTDISGKICTILGH